MPKKPKFKPEITRVKLNPEQAVLTCSCWSVGFVQGATANTSNNAIHTACIRDTRDSSMQYGCPLTNSGGANSGWRRPASATSS